MKTDINFMKAWLNGKILERSGYHKTQWSNTWNHYNCSCQDIPTLGENRGYRDVYIQHQGQKLHYVHQNLIATEDDSKILLQDRGYQTRLTKDRLNKHLLKFGYRIMQRDYSWFLIKPDDTRINWKGKAIIDKPTGNLIQEEDETNV